jgi:predicted N-formylglutamate amidohydrolase
MIRILQDSEPHPAEVINPAGSSPYVLVCEHASNRIPANLGTLGLPDADLQRHIAWDIGAEATARILSRILDAPLIVQRYSRLVYDCNRPPEADSAYPEVSEDPRDSRQPQPHPLRQAGPHPRDCPALSRRHRSLPRPAGL